MIITEPEKNNVMEEDVRPSTGSQTMAWPDNPSKSEVLYMGIETKLNSVGNIATVSVTRCDISPAESI